VYGGDLGESLVASDLLPSLAGKGQKLHVDLNVMPRHFLLVALGVHGAGSIGSEQPAEAMAAENAVDAGGNPAETIQTGRLLKNARLVALLGFAAKTKPLKTRNE